MSVEDEADGDFEVNNLNETNIVEFLNKKCKSVDDVKYWLEFFSNRLKNLDLQNEGDSSNELSLLRSMTEEARADLVRMRELKKKRELLMRKIANIQLETEEFVDILREKCERLKKLEKQREQMVALKEFKSILKKMNDAYQESTPKAIMFYSEAVTVYQNLPKDCNQNLEDKIYAKIEEWETKLIETVKSDFLRTMSKLGWGSNEMNALSSSQLKEAEKEQLVNQRNSLFLQLLGLQKPVKRNILELQNDSENVGELLPPISALLIVFKKRFYFHFYGDRKTNNVEKPEWYLTQVLKWVQDSRDYLDEEFQPLVNKMWSKPVNVKVMFVDGLLGFIRTKMRQDLTQVVYNETLLSHYVDEVLNFDRELESSIDVENIDCCFYSPIQQLLLNESVFPKWIEMESNLVKEKLDLLLSDWENCWKPEVLDDPYLKFIPRSANMFLTLLDCISNRYQRLPSFKHRKQFFLVQLELLDEFRTRLMQLKNQEKVIPLNESFIGILNSAYYVTRVLTQWSSEVQYSTLSLPNVDGVVNSSTIEIQGNVGPFDYQIETMNLFIQDCELILARYVANQIKEKVQLYRSQKFWSKSEPKKSQVKIDLVNLYRVF